MVMASLCLSSASIASPSAVAQSLPRVQPGQEPQNLDIGGRPAGKVKVGFLRDANNNNIYLFALCVRMCVCARMRMCGCQRAAFRNLFL